MTEEATQEPSVAEIVQKVRRIQIVANRAVNDLFAGEYSIQELIPGGFDLTTSPNQRAAVRRIRMRWDKAMGSGINSGVSLHA